jgi:DNA-binding transcriptional MerR regulator
MKYEAKKMSLVEELDSNPLSIEEMNKYLDEYSSEEDCDEDFLTEDWDDFDKINRKVEDFNVRIAVLEEELEQLKKQTRFSVSDSGGLASRQEIIEYKIFVLDEQKDLLLAHKDILEGVPGISNEAVFAEARKLISSL